MIPHGGIVEVSEEGASMVIATYKVRGMSCQHCVDAVTKALSATPGVAGVTVELENGSVTVESSHELARSDVAAAVEAAGYEIG
jgi:copper ion binding protein